MFLTEKCLGKVKAWTFANGSVHLTHVAKEEATAPAVALDAIFIQGTIFAHKGHDVATWDIPGTFLKVDNLDYVLMCLGGILAELMVKVTPSLYHKYVATNTKGKPVLCIQLEKVVYGMIKSVLLFYWKLVEDLQSSNLEISPYDPRVANKIINGQQMTRCWHVNDLFLGHADPDIVTQFLKWLSACYDTTENKLNITCGPRHDYLGMNIDFSHKGAVTFDMIPYIGKIFQAFPEKIMRVSSIPAADHLFAV
jgi:hypothetical protein